MEKSWTHTADVPDRFVKVQIEHATGDLVKRVEYCVPCGGTLKYRIEYNGDMSIKSWLRYEYEDLNLLRIDQMYDGPDQGSDLNQGDPFRPLNVYTHGPGSIGHIIRNQNYFNGSPSTVIYYYYDALGNMVTYSYAPSEYAYGNYEMDAFGNQIPGSPNWAAIDSSGPKEHLTGKMYDNITGLYYFHARWYDPEVGRLVSAEDLVGGSGGQRFLFCDNSPTNAVDFDGKGGKTYIIAVCKTLSAACEARLRKALALMYGKKIRGSRWFKISKRCQAGFKKLEIGLSDFRSDQECFSHIFEKGEDGEPKHSFVSIAPCADDAKACERRDALGARKLVFLKDEEYCSTAPLTDLVCTILHEIGHLLDPNHKKYDRSDPKWEDVEWEDRPWEKVANEFAHDCSCGYCYRSEVGDAHVD